MADDSLYSLLKKAHEVSSTAGAKIYGVEVAIVTNVQDPEKQGRVKVCFPRMPGKPESSWVRVVQPSAGAGRGFYWLPEVSDEVLVGFERGEAQSPYVLGALWNGKDKPPDGAYNDDNTTRMIQTKSGHQLVFEDKKDGESIVIADKSGKRTMTFDVANKKFLVEAAEGDINLKAEKKIVLDCEDLEIKTSKTGKLDIGSTFDLNLGDNGAIASGSTLTIKGEKVNINPTSGLAAQLAALAFKAAKALAAAAAGDAAESKQGSGSGSGGGGAGAGADAAGGGGGGDLSSDASPDAAEAAGPAGAAAPAQDEKEKPLADPDRTAADAATAAEVAKDTLDVQVVNLKGEPQKNLEVEITLPGDGDKKAGKTGDDGHFKLENLTVEGNAKLDIPDVQVAPEAPASAEGRVRFVQGGIDVAIGKATVVEIPPRVRRCRLRGMHFETDKTFLMPSAMTGIRQLIKVYKSFEGIAALINGHTDKQGAAEYNRGLSEERAKSIKAFLLDDAATWVTSYGSNRFGKSWGVHEDQQMLTAVADGDGNPFLQQPFTDGTSDDATKDAITRFQHSRLITETGKPSAETRKALVEAYMQLEGTSLDKGAKVELHGCGMTHPLPETAGDSNPDQPLNRRVEVFLFEGEIDPAPKQPCPAAGCEEYPKWVAQKILDIDLDEPPGQLDVQVVTSSGENVVGAQVHISGPLVDDGTTGDDGIASFEEIVPGSYSITAEKDGNAADDRTDVPAGDGGGSSGNSSGLVTAPKAKKKAPVKLTLKGPLDVFLTLSWLDPDGKEHLFPENTAVSAVFGAKDTIDLKLDANGLLKFTAERSKKAFSLLLPLADDKQYMAVAPASDTTTKDAVVAEPAIKALIDKQFRVFLLPKLLDQKFSDWKTDGTLKHIFDKLDDPATTALGSAATPIKLLLDPHWQFVRLEFFDRFFGHSDHGHKRVSLPPVMLDGFATDPGGTGKKDKFDTRSNWLASAADPFKAAQAVPWILPKGADGKGTQKPDAKTMYQMVNDAGSFVVSTTKDDRKIEAVTDPAKLKPSADRFKLYDLPPLWRSRKWFARGANVFFDKLTAAQMTDSLTLAKPLTFSLDDLVLCDANHKQVTIAPADRLAVFFHRFASAPEAGATSPVGVFRPDTAAKKSYFSEAAVATKGYVTDYPNWTRLVVAHGNLFEAFADRTVDDGSNDVVGARAATRWIDSIASGVAAGNQMANRPKRTDKDFFSIQPFYEQFYNQTNLKYTGKNTITQSFGRFDMSFLRCCDFDGIKEVGMSLHYFRLLYSFNNTPPKASVAAHPPPSPFHPPAVGFQAKRDDYVDKICANMVARWNGNEASPGNTVRGELIAKTPPVTIKAQVILFVQPVSSALQAHYNLQVVRPKAGTLGGRSFMQGTNGTGELGENASAPESTFSPGSYVAAHELGHSDSLPDEYSERASAFSNNELGFQMNTPGDIFETDGTNWDPTQVTGPDSGIMDGVQVMRNRYFWHSAEFAAAVAGVRFVTRYTQESIVYASYEVPPHELQTGEVAPAVPKRSYVYWPIEDKVDDTAGGSSRYDLLLYAMGEDRFTKNITPRGPIDGTLVMVVKLALFFNSEYPPAVRGSVLAALRNKIRTSFGDKFFATGKVRVGTPQEWEFKRCLIRVQPRFLIMNRRPTTAGDDQDSFDVLRDRVIAHFSVNVTNGAAPAASFAGNVLTLQTNATGPNMVAELATLFNDKFAEMLGFANAAAVTKATLKPYVVKVITSGGDAGEF